MVDQALKVKAMGLSAPDRLELVEALWDSLSNQDIPITASEKALLDARLAEADAHPDAESSWTEVQARLRQQLPR
jgi:putative addiction module component (TIGR02574 family)